MDCYNEFQGVKSLKVSSIEEVAASKEHILNVLRESNVSAQTLQDISLVFSKLEYWLQYYERTKNVRAVIPTRSDFEKKFYDVIKTNEIAKDLIQGWLANQVSKGQIQPQPNKNWIAAMKNAKDNLDWLKKNASFISYWHELNIEESQKLRNLIYEIFDEEK